METQRGQVAPDCTLAQACLTPKLMSPPLFQTYVFLMQRNKYVEQGTTLKPEFCFMQTFSVHFLRRLTQQRKVENISFPVQGGETRIYVSKGWGSMVVRHQILLNGH